MGNELLPFLHIAPWIKGRGGVETLLAQHRASDRSEGLAAGELALFDREPALADSPYQTQAFSWRDTPRGMRRAIQRALAPHAGAVMTYHNGWGLPWFADLDGAGRRIAYLHLDESEFGPWLPSAARWLDGVVAVNPLAIAAAKRLLPQWSADRFHSVVLPITAMPALRPSRLPQSEYVLGYAGRLVRGQKRSDRLVPFVAELKRLGLPFRLEILGEGPLRSHLERELKGESTVKFFGWADSDKLWSQLSTWDAQIFFSEKEGGPIVLVEGLAAGVLPIYPAIGGTLGDLYGPQIDPLCLYPPGDLAAAARALRDLLVQPDDVLGEKRRRGQALARLHQTKNYVGEFAAFARRIADLPRISGESLGQRGTRWSDWLPLGLITRVLRRELWR